MGCSPPSLGRIELDGHALEKLDEDGRAAQNGLLTPMLLGLLAAVSTVIAVGFFVDRVDGAMRAQAVQFLAA